MPSTFSPQLRIELIGTGEQVGVWGATANNNMGGLIEAAISGYASVVTTAPAQAFTIANGAADQARSAMIELSTTTGAAFSVYAPPVTKLYVLVNASAHTVTIYNSTVAGNTTAAGTGVAIPAGRRVQVMSNGIDFNAISVNATSSNVASTIVERDGSGNFAAGTITAALAGDVTGDVNGNVSGSAASLTGVNPVANGGTASTTVIGAKDVLETGRLEPRSVVGATTLALTDVGDIVDATGAVTVPPGVFTKGHVVVVHNPSGAQQSLLRGAGVTFFWLDGATGDRVLGVRCMCTVVCVGTNQFGITGLGVY
jgi:hypothetical protein